MNRQVWLAEQLLRTRMEKDGSMMGLTSPPVAGSIFAGGDRSTPVTTTPDVSTGTPTGGTRDSTLGTGGAATTTMTPLGQSTHSSQPSRQPDTQRTPQQQQQQPQQRQQQPQKSWIDQTWSQIPQWLKYLLLFLSAGGAFSVMRKIF